MTPFFFDFAAVCCSYCDDSNVCRAKNGANSSPVSSTPTKHCNNVYYSLSLGTANKKIETLLQKMKKQLPYVQNDISIIKERNNKHRCLYNRPWWFRCFQPLFWPTTTADPVRGEGGGGRCFRRDWMAWLNSTVAWPIARIGLITWTENFGWDWTGFTVWQK